jgi:transmembrane sensor
MNHALTPLDHERLDTALDWHVRLTGETTEQDWQAFTAWLEADPHNRLVFDDVDTLATEAGIAAALPAVADVIAFPSQTAPLPRRRAVGLWAGAAVAAAIALAFIVPGGRGSAPQSQTYATRVGESRNVTLADGSVMHLNTDTAVSVALSAAQRDVRLDKGEALFEVTPDTARPFVVTMGPKRVRVVGTAFNVLRHAGRVVVSVEQGKVAVSHGDNDRAVAALTPGDRYIADETSATYQVVRVDPATIGVWRQGQLVFHDIPLFQVVSELNRYFAHPVVIPDADVQALRFSGILKMDEESAVLRRLAAFLPITVQPETDRVVLLRGSSK